MIFDMNCPVCRGTGFFMSYDSGVAGCEEYEYCPKCFRTDTVKEKLNKSIYGEGQYYLKNPLPIKINRKGRKIIL